MPIPARLRTINLAPEVDFDVADEARLNAISRNANAKAKLDLAIARAGEQDLERARLAAAVKAEREGKREDVMRNYINDRETIPNIPVGVVNPQYLKQGMGPQEQGNQIDLAPVERKARVDLAAIDPNYSETFRTGMDTERETVAGRQRLAAGETRTGEKHVSDIGKTAADIKKGEETLTETKRSNKANEWLKQLGIIQDGKTKAGKTDYKPLPGPARENLSKVSTNEVGLKNLFNNAEQGFFGKAPGGNFVKDAKILFGGSGPDTKWWKQYQAHMNNIIKEFSGAAVTAPEAARLEKAFITPQTDPKIAAQLLQQSMKDIEAGRKKLAGSYEAGGFYNPDEINALLQDYGTLGAEPNDPSKKYLRQLLEEAATPVNLDEWE